MSVHGLLLPGWEDLSTWGVDDGHLYAQLTRNGHSNDDGPESHISRPRWPLLRTIDELSAAIARATGTETAAVLTTMAPTVSPVNRRRLGLPDP